MNIVLIILAWAATAFLTVVYTKAGSAKLTKPIEGLAAAGLAWVKQVPAFVVRLIGLLELIGVYGLILASVAFEFVPGFEWAQSLAVAAAFGLVLVMLVAIIMHTSRKEIKYTYKINLQLFFAALVAAVALSLVTLPLI
ncbi:MAG: DoxX family protein [Micrococcales bacterium]